MLKKKCSLLITFLFVAEPNIIGEIKSHRLRWLGHVERMGEDRAVKRAYLGRATGKRPVGRPKYRWKDEVERDLRALQAESWELTAQDRQGWRFLVSEAKTQFGSLRHCMSGTWCVKLDLIDCGMDNEEVVMTGDVPIEQYPFVGVLYYIYFGDIGETRAVTTVTLIHKEFMIANALDIGEMPKHNFRKQSRVLIGESWPEVGRKVRNYVIHPEYGQTFNTLALVQLKDPIRFTPIKPICLPQERLRDPVFYIMKFNEDFSTLQKQVFAADHVPGVLCKDFYVHANLYTKSLRPPHVACAVLLDEERPCVWEAGAALVSRDVWGRWQLLGVGVRGPGCGAPSRYLDISSYAAWIAASLDRFQRITISKINKQKYVLRSSGASGMNAYQRFGACDPEEKTNSVYREAIKINTDTVQFQFFTYNLTILQNVEYTCLTLEIINGSAVSEMRVKHFCPRVNFEAPCHFYRGSTFDITVYIIFSKSCLFEINAWGFPKDMQLLDIQEWKWEEGSYYEDFYPWRTEYRGQTYMTEFGYEPMDAKMWVPEYDLWTTTGLPLSPTTDAPVIDPCASPPTEPETTTRTKKRFKLKTLPGGQARTTKHWSMNLLWPWSGK